MKRYSRPPEKDWVALTKRPSSQNKDLDDIVRKIVNDVKIRGDKALFEYSGKLDNASLTSLKVPDEEIVDASEQVSHGLKKAIDTARKNIDKFHAAQAITEPAMETTPGVRCWRKNIPIEKVGLYVPGGSAPLFSTVLMLGIPAVIAGCNRIIVCTPPDRSGKANPVILYTCSILGIREIYVAGGAQAIAAMAFGTESVPAVNKIFGPGNQYVTRAKEIVMEGGVAIDMPAGPSEVLVIADKDADPEFIASDLLSQAEHGPDSQVILLTDDEGLVPEVEREINLQLEILPRKGIAQEALSHSRSVVLDSLEKCVDFSNLYAPEHLIINTVNPQLIAEKVKNAGSVFLGKYSCESAGDYASGTNHTLPTNGFAVSYSGVSTESFMKRITYQEISFGGINSIGPAIMEMAEAESLLAHKNSVSIRLKNRNNV